MIAPWACDARQGGLPARRVRYPLLTAGGATYVYDGDGNRVMKSGSKIYWFAGSEILDETDQTGSMTNSNFNEYVFFGSSRIARRDSSNNVYFYLADQIGSSRKILQNGQTTACYDADFEPFGKEHVYINTCAQNYKFTGKERDTESNLDNFGARYYASSTGRFMTPDWDLKPVAVPYAKFGDPQTLNLYSYVENSPLNRIDADGHENQSGGQTGTTYQETDSSGRHAQTMCENGNTGQNGQCAAQNNNEINTKPPTADPAGTRTDPNLNPSPNTSNSNPSQKSDPTVPLVAAGAGLAPQANGPAVAAKAAAEAVGKQIKPGQVLRSGKDAAKDAMEQSRLRQLAKQALDTLGGVAAGLANGATEVVVPLLVMPHAALPANHTPDCKSDPHCT